MLTIRQQLNKLPQGLKELAFEAINTQIESEADVKYILKDKSSSIFDAVSGAFIWGYTPEGPDFWIAVVEEAKIIRDNEERAERKRRRTKNILSTGIFVESRTSYNK